MAKFIKVFSARYILLNQNMENYIIYIITLCIITLYFCVCKCECGVCNILILLK